MLVGRGRGDPLSSTDDLYLVAPVPFTRARKWGVRKSGRLRLSRILRSKAAASAWARKRAKQVIFFDLAGRITGRWPREKAA